MNRLLVLVTLMLPVGLTTNAFAQLRQAPSVSKPAAPAPAKPVAPPAKPAPPVAPATRICNICYRVESTGDLTNFQGVIVQKATTYNFVQTVYSSLGAKLGQTVTPKPGMVIEQAATQVTLTPANMTGTRTQPRSIQILGNVAPVSY